jgi:single-strand DNA-binding protein
MSQGGYVTLVGFVAQDPQQRETKNGSRVTDLRVGATTRVQDRVTMQWRDGDTSYYNVSCWRRLGDHVRASLRKGDPVVIKGSFRARTFEDKTTGLPRTAIDIVADTVGHDLNRGIANYMRPQQQPVNAGTDPGADGSEDVAEGRDMIDEEAIEQFGRELDESFNEADLGAPAPGVGHAAGAAAPSPMPS